MPKINKIKTKLSNISNSKKRELIITLIVILVFTSCRENLESSLNGRWKLSYISDSRSTIDYIEFDDSNAFTLDDMMIYTSLIKTQTFDSIILYNEVDTFKFGYTILAKDSILIQKNSLHKIPQISKKEDFRISIHQIKASPISPYYPSKYIAIKKDSFGNTKFRLGDKIASINELPKYILQSHQESPILITLAIDKNIDYKTLNEFYKWCFINSVTNVKLITHSDGFGGYEGISEYLVFWNEDVEVLRLQAKLPPLPPRQTRREFINMKEKVIEMQNFSKLALKDFSKNIVNSNLTILITFDPKIKIVEYIELRSSMEKIMTKNWNRIAKKELGKTYNEIELIEEKRQVKGKVAEVLTERK